MASLQVIAVAEDLQASLEDVFYEFQVDLTWHGHDHIYGELHELCKQKGFL